MLDMYSKIYIESVLLWNQSVRNTFLDWDFNSFRSGKHVMKKCSINNKSVFYLMKRKTFICKSNCYVYKKYNGEKKDLQYFEKSH